MVEVLNWGGGAQPDDVACRCGCVCVCDCICNCNGSPGDYEGVAIDVVEIGNSATTRDTDVESVWFDTRTGAVPV